MNWGSGFDFPVANQTQHPYTLMVEALASSQTNLRGQIATTSGLEVAGRRGETAPETRIRCGKSCASIGISVSREPDGCQRPSASNPIGRGQMARRRTKRDAIEITDCRFAMLHLPALTISAGAPNAEVSRPTPLKPFASHCATGRTPVFRRPLVGARARGVHYGYQENAGGCHPPGRNTDCRYSG